MLFSNQKWTTAKQDLLLPTLMIKGGSTKTKNIFVENKKNIMIFLNIPYKSKCDLPLGVPKCEWKYFALELKLIHFEAAQLGDLHLRALLLG